MKIVQRSSNYEGAHIRYFDVHHEGAPRPVTLHGGDGDGYLQPEVFYIHRQLKGRGGQRGLPKDCDIKVNKVYRNVHGAIDAGLSLFRLEVPGAKQPNITVVTQFDSKMRAAYALVVAATQFSRRDLVLE